MLLKGIVVISNHLCLESEKSNKQYEDFIEFFQVLVKAKRLPPNAEEGDYDETDAANDEDDERDDAKKKVSLQFFRNFQNCSRMKTL